MPAKPAAIRIEKGIPVPPGRSAPIDFPFLDMAPGDSFFVAAADQAEQKRARSRIWMQAKKFSKQNGGKFAFIQRIVEGGVRCWRFK